MDIKGILGIFALLTVLCGGLIYIGTSSPVKGTPYWDVLPAPSKPQNPAAR